MLRVTLLMTRGSGGEEHREHSVSYIDPQKIDTITVCNSIKRSLQKIPDSARSVIRYIDVMRGYRLLYVEEKAEILARMRTRAMLGEDPDEPDYGLELKDE